MRENINKEVIKNKYLRKAILCKFYLWPFYLYIQQVSVTPAPSYVSHKALLTETLLLV